MSHEDQTLVPDQETIDRHTAERFAFAAALLRNGEASLVGDLLHVDSAKQHELKRLGELSLANAETKEGLGPIVTYEDTLLFAGDMSTKTLKGVNRAWGALFSRGRYGEEEGVRAAGLVFVMPDGSAGSSRGPEFSDVNRFIGWGVTLESLSHAYESGTIHAIPDLSRENKSYIFFKSYLDARKATQDS